MIIFISALNKESNTILYDNTGKLTPQIVERALINTSIPFREVYEVEEKNLRYMVIDERITVSDEFANNLIRNSQI